MMGDDDFDTEDFEDSESIEGLTAQAIDANLAGDKDKANALFATRDALASAKYPPKGEAQTGPTSAAGGSGIEAALSWSDIEEAAWAVPEGILLLEAWGDQAETRVRKALGWIFENDELREMFVDASDTEKIDQIADAWQHAKHAEPLELVTTPREADPSPTTRIKAQHALDEIMRENPVGSENYKSPAVQARVQNLHRIISGDGPVVGSNLRSV